MTPCIYYHPEAYTTSGPKLMGRNAAGESFLRGYLSHSHVSEFWVQVQALDHAQHFASAVTQAGRTEPVKVVDRANLAALSGAGLVYYPGPGIGEHAFHRAAAGGTGAWSLCGITHTTASSGAMDAVVDLVTSPLQPWDAVICTSAAVKNNVERVLQAQVDYLQARLGLSKLVLPQLPVIPLGIHTDDFVFTDEDKSAARISLGVDVDTLVVLFMGRLSFHAKAHPLAMYQALEAAAKASGKSIVLVECGWHANDFIAKAYADAASLACPSVRVVTLDGRKTEDRHTAWAAADVFCSLADNIQETFGITPIEAMAAGLPVVVSDWDGYKDTVRDGIDGFRIATAMPQSGLGADLAYRHALEIDTYDMYCGHSSSLVSVDVTAASEAFTRLFTSAELRQQMGAAGRQRAVEVYDWRHIIAQYEALWAQLSEIRLAQAQTLTAVTHPWPARMDPFHAFASYPTQILSPETVLHRVDADVESAMNRVADYQGLAMVNYAKLVIPTEEEIRLALAAAEATAAERVALIAEVRRPYVLRALAWLMKLGVLRH
jgi:glycosyltransferase involved in cell wall biosynthesis